MNSTLCVLPFIFNVLGMIISTLFDRTRAHFGSKSINKPFKKGKISDGSFIIIYFIAFIGIYSCFVLIFCDFPCNIFLGGWTNGINLTVHREDIAIFISSTAVMFLCYDKQISQYIFGLLFAIYGIIITNDLFNIYVWFEVLLFITCGIFFRFNCSKFLDNYIIISLISTAIILLSIGLIYRVCGVLNMTSIISITNTLSSDISFFFTKIAISLMIIGFLIKMAIFPYMLWMKKIYCTIPSKVFAILLGLYSKIIVFVFYKIYKCFNAHITDNFLIPICLITIVLSTILMCITIIKFKSIKSRNIINFKQLMHTYFISKCQFHTTIIHELTIRNALDILKQMHYTRKIFMCFVAQHTAFAMLALSSSCFMIYILQYMILIPICILAISDTTNIKIFWKYVLSLYIIALPPSGCFFAKIGMLYEILCKNSNSYGILCTVIILICNAICAWPIIEIMTGRNKLQTYI